ncbi:hypothetical protein DID88_005053 [Monilinia fructigena]|uniref:ENTH domain-containing protein n=1 Tax=Monilinia fructigena TaxID=38457 RepID=A0A395ISC0_9HELO|nr:hypothetical protein DID88_005053 [Monilinia fructigena]
MFNIVLYPLVVKRSYTEHDCEQAAPPKSKYIEHILIATHSGEAGVAEIFRALQNRLRDSTWTVVFKSLITVHLMIREGSPDVTLAYLARHRNMLAISSFTDVQTQGRNIRHYTNYLTERAKSFRDTKCDFDACTGSSGTLPCYKPGHDQHLGHFFEMSKPDAERAMEIYRNFTRQTDFVVSYLSVARQYEHQTRVEVPKLKHAPVNLGKQLEDYLMDPDFEVNRRQYLAEQESSKGGKSGATHSHSRGGMQQPPQLNGSPFQIQQQQQQQQQQFQQGGFVQQQTGFQDPGQFAQQQGFNGAFNMQPQAPVQPQPQPQPLQPHFTGAGFGGYTPQQAFQPSGLPSIPQESAVNFQQQGQQQMSLQTPQETNPFRQSMMANTTGMAGSSFPASPPITSPATRPSTNPFAKSISPQPQPYSPPPDQQFQQQPIAAPLRSMQTGTNPFAKNLSIQSAERPQTSGPSLAPQPTGNTNPFRQSQFVNTATGMGWQNAQQPIGGGLDHLQTVPVFPRPGQQQPWQQ